MCTLASTTLHSGLKAKIQWCWSSVTKDQTVVSILGQVLGIHVLDFLIVPKSIFSNDKAPIQPFSPRPICLSFWAAVDLFEPVADTYASPSSSGRSEPEVASREIGARGYKRIPLLSGRSDGKMGGHGRPLTRDSLVSSARLRTSAISASRMPFFPHLKMFVP